MTDHSVTGVVSPASLGILFPAPKNVKFHSTVRHTGRPTGAPGPRAVTATVSPRLYKEEREEVRRSRA